MDKWQQATQEIQDIFSLFFDETIISCRLINTSINDSDLRETVIAKTSSGGRWVIKLADNDFTFPERIKVWQRTVQEYLDLGYYCPKILCDKTGAFPAIEYKGHSCVAYAEEYSKYAPIEEREHGDSERGNALFASCHKDIWSMTAKVAAKHLDYTEYPSGYCMFETFCPSDETDEVLENALCWKEYADTLPGEFGSQVQRIWRLWNDNRAALEKVYKKLPASVFQADLNKTNILIDDNGRFAGVYDFNLCGKDVFLNYLMRENLGDFEAEIKAICDALKTASEYYHFSDIEKDSALMLYRCIKPLWFTRVDRLKTCRGDNKATKELLDKTEHYLTADIDLRSYMG